LEIVASTVKGTVVIMWQQGRIEMRVVKLQNEVSFINYIS